ncbi:SH3 domain-containing protein [Planctomycetota bacterium]|nr:SH3 domain-containing protein [Planctomycetota bacterium]
MIRKLLGAAALGVALLAAAPSAHAQPVRGPVFRGPAVHDGAWETTKKWADPAAGPNDPSQGSFAYAYREWARERADQHVEDRTRLDCADLSINLIIEYAAINGLPLSWRVFNAPERRFEQWTNENKQFDSPEAFTEWSQWYLGAMNLADNTYAIKYEEWAGGDMVLMDWNQSPESPNFEGRTVWHTYLVGVPGELIYYGNINDGQALAVISTTGQSTLDRVTTHPDRHGLSPRRFSWFKGAVWEPREPDPEPTTKTVAEVTRASRLNLRSGPGTDHERVGQARRGDVFDVVGEQGVWRQLRQADGSLVWAHGYYMQSREVEVTSAEVDVPDATGFVSEIASSDPTD